MDAPPWIHPSRGGSSDAFREYQRFRENQEDETEECSREPSLEDIIVTWELVAWEDAGHTEEDYEDLSHLFG